MDSTAQHPSLTFRSRDQAKTPQNRVRRAMPQSDPVAREGQTAHHMEDPKSPTVRKDKGAVLAVEMPTSRGSITNGRSGSGKITRARATSVPPSPSQPTSLMKDRSLSATSDRADKVSSSVISGNKVKGSATQNNFIFPRDENSSQCIQDLRLTKPHRDRADIEKSHSDVCDEHLQKVREHSSYKRWKNDDEVRLLWIYSYNKDTIFKSKDFETGTQKRIVAVAVAKELEEELEESPEVDNALSYMFCQNSRNPEKLNDTAAIFRGLMWLLSLTQKSLTVCLEETYFREGKEMYTDKDAKDALSEILFGWSQKANVRRVYLVVGAINECHNKDILEFLDLIMRYKDLAKVKWVITSDYDDIWIKYIKYKLGPDNPSFETIHLNEGSKTLHDPSSEPTHLDKRSETLHNPQETIHQNERSETLDDSLEAVQLDERSETLHDPSAETTHPNERSKTLHNSSLKLDKRNKCLYDSLRKIIKRSKTLHDSLLKSIHLNERSQMESKVRERWRREQRQRKEALARGTKGTNKEVEREGQKSAKMGRHTWTQERGNPVIPYQRTTWNLDARTFSKGEPAKTNLKSQDYRVRKRRQTQKDLRF